MTTQIEKKNTVQAGQKTDGLKRLINRIKNIPAYTLLGLFAAFNIFVILWIIVTSFKSNRELYANVWSFPVLLQFVNYIKAWSVTKMDVYFVNSLIVVSLSVLLTLVVATPAAYVLTRISFKGSAAVTQFFTGGMGVPAAILFIPLFDMLAARGWVDSLPGLILVYVVLAIPFTIFLLTAFFATLPAELEEAAAVDGASPFAVFLRIMLPLASPGLLTAAILNFISTWNEYMIALIFITSDRKRTISLGLYSLQSSMQYTGDWVGMFAGVVILMVPTMIVYLFLSRRMISGITMGAIK